MNMFALNWLNTKINAWRNPPEISAKTRHETTVKQCRETQRIITQIEARWKDPNSTAGREVIKTHWPKDLQALAKVQKDLISLAWKVASAKGSLSLKRDLLDNKFNEQNRSLWGAWKAHN